MDILRDAPIMNLIGNEFQGIEGDEYVKAIVAKLGFDTRTARNIYYHIRGNDIKKASVLAIPSVLEKGEIIMPWKKGHKKQLKTAIQAAPISIGGKRYVFCVVNSKNATKNIRPYSVTLFSEKEIEEMYSNNNVPDGTNTTSHLTDTTNNPQSVAKVLRNYIQTKHVPMNNVVSTNISVDKDGNYASANAWGADYVSESRDIYNKNKQINCNRNMKQTIRLTESALRGMIKEAVNGAMAQRKPLKKVQSKHLNEDNLRNMIKESVRRALNESNIDVLNVNKYGSYELASSTDPTDEEKKIELLAEFGRAFEEVVQMYMVNLAGMFKRTNKQAYDKIMKLRNDLIKAGAFNITPENLGLKPYHMDDDSEYYSNMYDN